MSLFEQIQSGRFIPLADVSGAGPERVAAYAPVEPFTFLWGDYFPEIEDEPKFDADVLRSRIANLVTPNEIVSIDWESEKWLRGAGSNWGASGEDLDERHRASDRMFAAVEVIRSERPEWRLSWFALCPHIEARYVNAFCANRIGRKPATEDSQDDRYREFWNAIDLWQFQADKIAAELDWYCPSTGIGTYWNGKYAHDHANDSWYFLDDLTDRPSPIRVAQRTELDVALDAYHIGLKLTKDILPDKPMIPCQHWQWWEGPNPTQPWQHAHGEWLPSDWIITQLHQIRALADSVAVFPAPSYAGTSVPEFFAGPHWWAFLRWAWGQGMG